MILPTFSEKILSIVFSFWSFNINMAMNIYPLSKFDKLSVEILEEISTKNHSPTTLSNQIPSCHPIWTSISWSHWSEFCHEFCCYPKWWKQIIENAAGDKFTVSKHSMYAPKAFWILLVNISKRIRRESTSRFNFHLSPSTQTKKNTKTTGHLLLAFGIHPQGPGNTRFRTGGGSMACSWLIFSW